jgi:hypothetical protein
MTLPVMQEGLATCPVNTAPLQLIASLLSFFSWPVAKVLWMILNFACILIAPWLVIRLLPAQEQLGKNQIFIYLSFWSLLATRNAAGNGQSTLLVFICMLLSLVFYKKLWYIAGVALGIALSKYSLSIPILFYFLYKKEFRIIAVSLLTQVAGVLVLAWIVQTSPLIIVSEYIKVFQLIAIASTQGVQLTSLISNKIEIIYLVAALFTLGILGIIAWWVKNSQRYRVMQENTTIDLLILVALLFLGLLGLYHREYDVLVVIIYFGFITTMLSSKQWVDTPTLKNANLITLAISVAWLSRPGSILIKFFPGISDQTMLYVTQPITTFILSLNLCMALVLLYATLLPSLVQAKGKRAVGVQNPGS